MSFIRDNFLRIVEYAILACIITSMLYLLNGMQAIAVSLSITGNSTGQGLHMLSFAGEQLNASILQGSNCSTWQITALGAT